jgi:hypothetical protein
LSSFLSPFVSSLISFEFFILLSFMLSFIFYILSSFNYKISSMLNNSDSNDDESNIFCSHSFPFNLNNLEMKMNKSIESRILTC